MTNKKSKEKVNNRGAPVKDKDKRVDPVYHLYMWQSKRMEQEAIIRDISTAAMIRMAMDWFITALDTGRADVTASKLFDEKFNTNHDKEIMK